MSPQNVPNTQSEDDLVPSSTYKAGAEKTLEELQALDANDESLRKWKESLGIPSTAQNTTAQPNAKHVAIQSLSLEVTGRPDVVLDVSTPEAIEKLKDINVTIKEGSEYRFKVLFHVNNKIVSGLTYLHVVKRKGIRVDKQELMLGSYAPQAAPYTKVSPTEEAPSGFLIRGNYTVKSKFTDDDGHVHALFEFGLVIAKDWEA